MKSSYGALLARPGARALALACALGWLSFSSYALALVLAVEAVSGSFAVAGAAVGAFSLCSAVLAPLRGRIVDQHGPRALRFFALPQAAVLAALVVACAAGAAGWVLVPLAACAGALMPPLIATARALWPAVAGASLTQSAHALNAAIGDAALVLGPLLAGALAALVSPVAAFAMVASGATAGALSVAGARWEPSAAATGGAGGFWGVLRESPGLRTIVGCELALGLALGSVDVVGPALAATGGSAELGALPLAAFAGGSLATSLWAGSGRTLWPPERRFRSGLCALAAVMLSMLAVDTLAGLGAVLFVAGLAFGVVNVAVFELVERVVESGRAVEAFTWLTTAGGLGIAVGASAAGRIAEEDPSAALALMAFPALAAAAVAVSRRATLTGRRDAGAGPGPPD